MKDNMEELQRWDLWRDPEFPNDRSIEKCHNGDFVLFSDVAEREARFQARIEELEVIVSGKTMYDAAAVADARWRERIENGLDGYHDKDSFRAYIRSLLDSGEEEKASGPAIYEGYGRKWEPVKGTSALREIGDTGPDWDQCVYHMIGGRVQRFLMDEREAGPSTSPALEGREGEDSALAERLEKLAGLLADEFGNYITTGNLSGDYKEGQADAYLHAAQLVREAGLSPDRDNEGGEDENAYRRDPDGCYVCGVDEYAARARGRAESGLPVSQGMVRDGEVTVPVAAECDGETLILNVTTELTELVEDEN